MIVLKTSEEIEAMDLANRVVHGVLDMLAGELRPGVALAELDAMAEERTRVGKSSEKIGP